jgi:phosphatidylserine decarboxylase
MILHHMIPSTSAPSIPSRRWRLLLGIMRLLPQAALSRLFGQLADIPVPRAIRPLVHGLVARILGMDLSEAAKPLTAYESVNELFVRPLRDGIRTWPRDPGALASPVDGILGQLGHTEKGRLVQAKGRSYTVTELLGGVDVDRFANGSFITLYLSPRHYHRMHAPCAGAIVAAWHIPGALFPVNAAASMHIDNLFPRNERLICEMETPALGRVAVVAVGAYNVGRISAAFDEQWTGTRGERWVTNRPGGARAESRRYNPPLPTAMGAEIMAFHLGSTVVLLTERPVQFVESAEPQREIRLGEELGRPVT